MDNIFFDPKQLKSCGKNVIIGKTVRIRYPELVEIGDNVIIDDFTYISTAMNIMDNVHIASGCKIIGGKEATVTMESFSTLAPNVVLAAGSDDYIAGIATPMVPLEFKGEVVLGDIFIGRHCIVGANSTVLPNVTFEVGASVGAQSLVKDNLSEWSLYGGVPARKLKDRDGKKIEELEKEFLRSLDV
ncbi:MULTISPECIES: acyltransferase [unclassified Pseudoalteromonas]|uniref:acyltransferase n=1 Tax=unclassified Pseudoalteromonas TaxID=194690 RepID=UPI00209681D8|nr:acyltransferase [Pseudoalteromonas sp. XMcav2-N]MCO7188748.1 acyltransferase [Pseudoalteromonas sp. XMcav2-N]